MSTYADSLKTAKRFRDEWDAEYQGLVSADWSTKCLVFFPKDAGLQKRFQLGWERGRAQLEIEKAMKKTKEVV